MAETSSLDLLQLNVRVEEARDLRKAVLFGRMDPYVVLEIHETKQQSHVSKDGDHTPSWAWQAAPSTVSIISPLKLTVYHHHLIEAHTEIGKTGDLSLLSLLDGPVDKWIPLQHKGDPAGELHVILSLATTDGGELTDELREAHRARAL